MYAQLVRRPIAVSMTLIALVVLGLVAWKKMPVSLMPDIDIPQLTVQVSCPGYAAAEVEQRVVAPMRSQLAQVNGVKDMRSMARTDAGTVVLTFEPGTHTSQCFIEVNEKIDRAMNHMPRDLERPKVLKAGVMDLPAFYLDIYQKDASQGADADNSFAQLCRFATGVVAKRIEQMPQTAMVDVSGTVGSEIVCVPDERRLQALGMTAADVAQAIQANDITLEALSVADGIYRYNIHFDAQLITRNDVASIYIQHNGRLLQLSDLCTVEERPAPRNGLVRHNGRDAVTMAVIKQDDARMDDLRQQLNILLDDLRATYPHLAFDVARDQTHLLQYTMGNLRDNLVAGTLLASLVLFLFLRQWRLSLLVMMSIPLALLVTLLAFYVTGISLNVISLSGLVLGVGMIVDNAIIVVDSVVQRLRRGQPLTQAAVEGTREVFGPMTSSVLTTCSVFVPLVFLSGVAGALFFDQAMGVTYALVASLAVPVYLCLLFRRRHQRLAAPGGGALMRWLMRPYDAVLLWVLRHGRLCMAGLACGLPLMAGALWLVDKERMPAVPEDDALLNIDWNSGITTAENDRRVARLMQHLRPQVEASTAMVGAQQFLLPHTPDITSSEAVVYVKAPTVEALDTLRARAVQWLAASYPQAHLSFSPSGNLYNMIFSTNESRLEIRLQTTDGQRPDISQARAFTDSLRTRFPSLSIMPVVTEPCLHFVADPEQMALYHVTFDDLQRCLKEQLGANSVLHVNDGAQAVPVVVGWPSDGNDSRRLLASTVRGAGGTAVPVSYLLREVKAADYKWLEASASGGYYGIRLDVDDDAARQVMHYADSLVQRPRSSLTATYTGEYFSSRAALSQLALVLAVALTLLFLILAAQFESLVQPVIILAEMVVDVLAVVSVLWLSGQSLNVMSMIGMVVMSGIVINDSILKVDTINRLRRSGHSLQRAVLEAGHSRLRPIVMTSATTILALVPFLWGSDMGSALQLPLSLTIIIGMTVGTLVSLFLVPLFYCMVYRKRQGR